MGLFKLTFQGIWKLGPPAVSAAYSITCAQIALWDRYNQVNLTCCQVYFMLV